jgi:hypothetical protein
MNKSIWLLPINSKSIGETKHCLERETRLELFSETTSMGRTLRAEQLKLR